MKKYFALHLLIMLFVPYILTGQDTSAPLWMRYPAISPNGETIAFTYKGDIYTVPANGGVAIPLTTNPAHDYMPVWSPDGNSIAFASNRFGNFDIYIVSAIGGTPTRLTFHSGNELPSAFSPDGKNVIFSAQIADSKDNILFPSPILTELYSVPVSGGRIEQIFTTPAENAVYNGTGDRIAYHDRKGYEDPWRKRHTSSVTRDIWIYDVKSGKHAKITSFDGEDRNPVFSTDNRSIFYLTEQFGSFNVAQIELSENAQPKAISHFTDNPVRFLSMAQNGKLSYGYNGEIYTQIPGEKPHKVNIQIHADQTENELVNQVKSNGANEMAVSPDGKEVAFVIRGEIFVTSTKYNTTKRITNTPEQERSVSFSPNGRKLLYAGERDGKWKVFETSIVNKDEPCFSLSTLLKEEVIVDIAEEAFQPAYSPDGKEVAFLKDRQTLSVKNVKTGTIRDVVKNLGYSYSDGDQHFEWSPDSQWLLISYDDKHRWPTKEVGLVKADGSELHNLTLSGYSDENPRWMMGGKVILWQTDRNGYRSHGSWGSEFDVYALFLTQEAYDEFKLHKLEWELLKEKRKKEKKEKEEKEKNQKEGNKKVGKGQKSDDESNEIEKVEPLVFQFDNLDERKVRLTINSSDISDFVLSPDGENLYYLCRFEKGFDLWVNKLRDNETKLLLKFNGYAGNLQIDKEGKNLYLTAEGELKQIEIPDNKQNKIKYNAEYRINYPAEREYMFEHIWRQVSKKFYDPAIHGLDWEAYKANYSRFLPHINNNFDFAEMAGEMLGELNGSHTGARYYYRAENGEATATLGAFYDPQYTGNGLKITEIMAKSPLINAKGRIKPGIIIEKIDDEVIEAGKDFYQLLNRKADKNVLLTLFNLSTNERWTETVRPLPLNQENKMLYKRWVESRNAEVEKLSNGRIGYVHVSGMDSESYREVYSQLFGRHADKEAVIVDTRFNGGGWLHDDLATLLSGKHYADFMPRGQYIASEPISKWYKPSVIIVGEGNYSDAHGFPYTYKTLGIGKVIGMPVPGTMTAVWWETLQDPTIVFGIPQMGVKDLNGNYLENSQLEPDIKVAISPEEAATGKDTQLEAAVNELLKELQGK